MEPYPIKLTTHVRTYAFGGRLIPDLLGKEGLPEGTVAETWEVSDYQDTTGTVTNGPYAGRTLHELVTEYPDEIVGEGWRGPHFPLLEKFLDASHMLPVHLHADDETARRKHGEPHGKTEAWHILWAGPDATVLVGIEEGVGREVLYEAFKKQDYDSVMPRYPVQTGDTVYVPAGVIHSFGPDTLIFEVQQTSDLGQSVMPEDLYGNPLDEETWEANIDAALDELRTHYQPLPNPGLALEDGPAAINRRILCCVGPYFALERWTLREPYTEPPHPQRFLTLSNVGDPVSLEYAGGTEHLEHAESCILPAATGEVRLAPEGEASLIVCYVPNLEEDIVALLRGAGHSDEEIRALGEIAV